MKFPLLLITCFLVCEFTQSANILAVIPSPFYSHQATYRPLWRELARRGHKITLITTDLMEQNDNITQIDFSGTYELFEKLGTKDIFLKGFSLSQLIRHSIEVGDAFITYQLTHPGLVQLIKSEEKFDLLFIEILIQYFTPLSLTFKAPYIGLTTMDAPYYIHSQIGNAMHPSIYPIPEAGFELPLTFRERLISIATTVGIRGISTFIYSVIIQNYVRKYIAEDCPDDFFQKNSASLIFVNANPIFFPTRPITPTTVNLEGGLHLTEPAKLPKDLQNYLDDSKHGCIYFSLGSTVNGNTLSLDTIEMFRKTFENLAPMTILWKFENETLANKPKNLEIKKWFPQQDILRHPNIKLFITQGGLQSMEEAIDSAVPILGMPFYGDQFNNVNKMVSKKFGIRLDVATMDQKGLENAIQELLKNPLYKDNAQKFSKIQKDRPMRPLEKAIWWTEYVLRHGGTSHLNSPSADIPLYQYFFLDIIAFVTVLLVVFTVIFYYSFKIFLAILRKIFRRKRKESKQKVN